MKLDLDDPKLTAYALGELPDAERAEVEAALASDPAARAQVDEIRAAGALLTKELAGEAGPGLSAQHKQAIAVGARGGVAVKPVAKLTPRTPWMPLAAAATVLLLVSVGFVAMQMKPEERQTALANKNTRGLGLKGAIEESEARAVKPESEKLVADHAIVSQFSGVQAVEHSVAGADPAAGGGGDASRQLSSLLGVQGAERKPAEGFYRFDAEKGSGYGRNAPTPQSDPRAAKLKSTHGNANALRFKAPPPAATAAPEKPGLTPLATVTAAPKPETKGKPEADATKKVEALATILSIQPVEPAPNEDYNTIQENPFKRVMQDPLSTFSIDVDTAAYSNIRRFLKQNTLPPKDAIRIEEMVNYFNYNYPQPTDAHPFSVNIEIATCPWKPEHRLARVGLKGKEVDINKRPASNLVFLIDVSGSMNSPERLPLVKDGLKLMVEKLNENDRVSIVVYAGASGLVLPPTTGDRKTEIIAALDRLNAGGSTNGGQGIQLAYDTAVHNFVQGGINRVMLCTDGDWNVGVTNKGDLVKLIEEKAKSNVFLTVLGYGMGNYKDAMLEQIADKGNGAYAYIDDIKEAQKVLVEQMSGTLLTIAKDVKIQVEFNPTQFSAYRLVGYENRMLAHEDFNNDKKDAGEIGAGHTVTALYELVPVDKPSDVPLVDPLKYQGPTSTTAAAYTGEALTVKLRYKQPDGQTSQLIEVPAKDEGTKYGKASKEFKFAAAVASFGLLLRGSEFKGNATFDSIVELAAEVKATDKSGRGSEFVDLVQMAKALTKP